MKKAFLITLLYFSISISTLSQERIYKEIGLSLINDINLADEGIFKVHSLAINNKEDVVLFDFGETEIIHFNIKSLIINRIGNGRGRGPGEFKQVMNLKILKENIYISDREKGSVMVWGINRLLKSEYKIEEKFVRPSRIAICNNNNGIYILSAQYGPNGIFHHYDKNFNLQKSFVLIENNDERLPYFTDGNITCDDEGNLYHAARYLNSIKKYNNNGDLLFNIPVYNFEPNKKIIEKKERWISPAKGIRRASGDVYALRDNLIVGYSDSKYVESKLIDVYNSKTGEYKYSIKVRDKFNEFAISDNKIAFLVETSSGDYHVKLYEYDNWKLD